MKEGNKLKKFFKSFWKIVWQDPSPKGWITTLIFLLIVIFLIIKPLSKLITGTALPLVIVESCSMYHQDNLISNLPTWYENHDLIYFKNKISLEMFENFPFKKGFNKGDILFVTGAKPEKIELGDVIIFTADYKNPIIHRVINITKEGEEYIFSTMGDNNQGQQFNFEKRINENQLIGQAKAKILPYAGWIKLIFFEWAQPENNKGFCEGY